VFINGLVEPQVDEAQFEMLLDKSTQAISRIINGILGNSNADEKAVKKEEKNFPSESE
jgi:hypothetical protein